MDDVKKSKAQLIQEMQGLRRQVAALRELVGTREAAQSAWQAAPSRYARLSQALCSPLELNEILSILLEEVRDWLESVSVSVWLLDLESKDLVCREVVGPQDHMWRDWHTGLDSLAGLALRSGEGIVVPDAQKDARYDRALDHKTGLISRSLLILPLCAQGKVSGVLWVMDTEPGRFSAADLIALEPVAVIVALLVQDLHLHDRVLRASAVEVRLLEEVNHRVRSNLSVIVGLLYAARHQSVAGQTKFVQVMDELIGRVQSIAIAHNMLSASGWGPVSLSELTQQVALSALRSMSGKPLLSIHVEKSLLQVTSHIARSLALIMNELVINTLKQLSSSSQVAHINIGFLQEGDILELGFCGAKACRSEEILLSENFNSNLKLVHDIVRENLDGTVTILDGQAPGVFITFNFRQSGD